MCIFNINLAFSKMKDCINTCTHIIIKHSYNIKYILLHMSLLSSLTKMKINNNNKYIIIPNINF